MDFLETSHLLQFILIIELIILFLFILSIVISRAFLLYQAKQEANDKKIISRLILEYLQGKNRFVVKRKLLSLRSPKALLFQMEVFDRRMTSEEWRELKHQMAIHSLLPQARIWATSPFWQNRNYAARCFVLFPMQEDRDVILTLLDDSAFLVRSIAAVAAVALPTREGIERIVLHMTKEKGYAYYAYRDILIQGDSRVIFDWLEEMATQHAESSIKLACLDVLGSKTIPLTPSFVEQQLASANPDIRYAIVKVLSHNIQRNSLAVLLESFRAEDEKMRAQAVFGFQNFPMKETIEKLTIALRDDSWLVRSKAAMSLKKMGKMGISVLQRQTIEANQQAYEVAQYALAFDGELV